MRLFLFILTALFATSPGYVLTDNNVSVQSVADVLPGDDVIILTSSPQPGRYTDSNGKEFSYGITRTTLINVSDNPLQLTINCPADSFAFFSVPDSYVKLFLAPDTLFSDMQFDRSSWYVPDGLKPFLDAGFKTSTTLQETIDAKQERVFYIGALYYKGAGVPRTGLVLKGQDLFFRPARLDSLLIPCGEIIFKK